MAKNKDCKKASTEVKAKKAAKIESKAIAKTLVNKTKKREMGWKNPSRQQVRSRC